MENNELFIERKNFMNGLIRLFKNDNFNTENGKVISIDGEWGIGKTFFKDKFKGELENEKFIVMEYNAWENDYEEDPFPSLVGNMVSQMESFNKSSDVEKVINNIKTNSLKILKELMPVLVVGLAKYFGVEEVFKIFEEAKEGTKIITKNITEIIFDYNKKEKTIEDFKNSMSDFRIEYTQYKQSLEIDSPERRSKVIILIDELDRCKPNYALKVLERIKHFFNIPDYIFVFLNNKKQIESTVNSIYGIKNGDVYLEKFYDLELNLPVPDKKEFINMLIENNFENSDYDLFERFLFDAFKFYFVDSDLSLRVIEKSFIYYKTIVDLKPNFRTFFETLSFPLFFFEKIFNKDIYKSYLERNEAFNVTEFLKSDIIQNKNVSFDADKYMGKEIFINKKCFFTLLNYSNSDDLRFVKRDKEGWEESADFMGKDLRTIRIIENNHTTNTHLYEEHEVKFVYELLEIFDFKE